jgi:Putative phage tail protein/Hypothetical glycosyl hydrolase family 15
MATLVVVAAGALGASAGTAAAIGTAVSVATTLASIGYTVYSALNQPTQRTEGPRLGDLSVQSSARGAPLPKVWGSMRIAGNLIDGKKYEIRTEEEVGGKGFMGGGGGVQVNYSYFADFAVSLCDAGNSNKAITGVRQVWLNSKLWYTAADDASDTELEASDDHERYGKLYLGTTSQLPDPTLEAIHGAGNVPPYRRTAYIVFTRLPLLNFGNAIPNVSVEVCNTPESLTAPTALPGGNSGGLSGSSNIARDPETGRLFLTTFNDGYLRVFDSSAENIGIMTLPGQEASEGLSSPCYVPSTREIWAPYDTSNSATAPYWSSIAILDPDALVVKTYFTIPQTDNGPAFYNPARDEVIVHDNWAGAQTIYIDPQTRVVTSGANLFGSGLCFGCLYIAPHEAIAVWGFDDRIRLVDANTYGLIADYDATEFGTTLNWVAYDDTRDVLYWCNGNGSGAGTNLYTIDLDPLSTGGTPVLGSARTLPYEPVSGMCYARGKIWIRNAPLSGADIFGLDPDTLAVETSIEGVTTLTAGLYPIDGRRFLIAGDKWKVPIRGLLPNSGIPLAEIVEDLCVAAGLATGDLVTNALNNIIVHGYVRAQPMQATAALQPLMLTYQFDGVESDYLLQFPKRDGSSIATIPEDDLGAREIGQDPGPPLAISRMQETDLPTALSVHYSEPRLSYQQGSQIHRRVYTRSQQTVQIDLPIAMTNTYARRLSRRLMNRSWVERTRYRFAVGPEYLYLDPGDIVKIVVDNATHLVRLDKVEFGAPGLVLAEGVAQRITLLPFLDEVADDLDAAPIYEEGEEEAPPDEFPTETLGPLVATRLVLLDIPIPILLDAHDDPGFYYAVAGYTTGGWGGAVLFKSIDDGATYTAYDSMGVPAGIGAATDVLEEGPTTIWDNGNSVTVIMTSGTLASDLEANVLSGKNAAALGVDGRWEIIQWRTATLNIDGSYTLTNLLRGRHGTEHNVANHEAGDLFVVLTPASIDRAGMNIGERGLARKYKAVSLGLTLAGTSAQGFTNTCIGLKPYSPVHVTKVSEVDGDIVVSWIRRTRAVDYWADGVDVPLFEESERYDLEVLNGTTVVRTVSGLSSPSYTYTLAMQIADFGVEQSFIDVLVYQLSAMVGRGYPSGRQIPTMTPNEEPVVGPPSSDPPAPPMGGGIKTLFPRLGRYSIGSPQNYGSSSAQEQLARVDMLIISFTLSWGSAGAMNAAVDAIKAINPAIKIVNYVCLDAVHATLSGQLPLRNKLNAEAWWLYPHGTSGSPVPSFWAGVLSTNLTNFCPADGGGDKWNTWLPEYWYDHIWSLITNLDGVFTDNVLWRPRVTGDWNRDGSSDDPHNATTAAWYRAGMLSHLNHIRSIFSGAMVLGNIGDWQKATTALPEYEGELDGGILEGYIGNSWSPEGIDANGTYNGWGSWNLLMTGYRKVKAYAGSDKILVFQHKGKRTDYKGFRYGFASCLMDDAYYDFADSETGGVTGQYVRWFDEYDLAGTSDTAWLGTAVDSPPTAAWQNGVYRRRFSGGMVLVNPRGNGARVVTIESGYKRFVGTQDPVVNNGSSATSFSIADRDGLFLYKI